MSLLSVTHEAENRACESAVGVAITTITEFGCFAPSNAY